MFTTAHSTAARGHRWSPTEEGTCEQLLTIGVSLSQQYYGVIRGVAVAYFRCRFLMFTTAHSTAARGHRWSPAEEKTCGQFLTIGVSILYQYYDVI
jgi:hypothetical protein